MVESGVRSILVEAAKKREWKSRLPTGSIGKLPSKQIKKRRYYATGALRSVGNYRGVIDEYGRVAHVFASRVTALIEAR